MSFAITVVPIAGSFSGVEKIPAPSRLIGALLWGAYNAEDEDVVKEIEKIVHLPQPTISFSDIPVGWRVASFSAGNPIVNKENNDQSALKDLSIPGVNGGKIGFIKKEKYISKNGFFSYFIDGDIDRELVNRALSQLSYFGKSSDMAVFFTEDKLPDGKKYVHQKEKDIPGALKLREWSRSLIDYYDEKYEQCFVFARSAEIPSDRISQGSWLTFDDKTNEADYVVLSTSEAFKQKMIPSALKSIRSGHEKNPFPIIDGNGKMRGIAVPYGENVDIELLDNEFSRFIDVQKATPLRTQNIEYWSTPADKYISATPYFGHPDEFVAVFELQKAGFIVNRISATPFHHSQGTIANAMKAPSPYQRWWVELEGSSSGVVQLGHLQETGAGLFRPVRHQEDRG